MGLHTHISMVQDREECLELCRDTVGCVRMTHTEEASGSFCTLFTTPSSSTVDVISWSLSLCEPKGVLNHAGNVTGLQSVGCYCRSAGLCACILSLRFRAGAEDLKLALHVSIAPESDFLYAPATSSTDISCSLSDTAVAIRRVHRRK